jgi:hypothetical protein
MDNRLPLSTNKIITCCRALAVGHSLLGTRCWALAVGHSLLGTRLGTRTCKGAGFGFKVQAGELSQSCVAAREGSTVRLLSLN